MKEALAGIAALARVTALALCATSGLAQARSPISPHEMTAPELAVHCKKYDAECYHVLNDAYDWAFSHQNIVGCLRDSCAGTTVCRRNGVRIYRETPDVFAGAIGATTIYQAWFPRASARDAAIWTIWAYIRAPARCPWGIGLKSGGDPHFPR